MGAYEQSLRKSLLKRAFIFSKRVARALMRRAARLCGSNAAAKMNAFLHRVAHVTLQQDTLESVAWILNTPPRARTAGGKPSVVHVIGSLAAGGAERQLALCAIESKRLGLATPIIVTLNPCVREDAHYTSMVTCEGIDVRHAGAQRSAAAHLVIRNDAQLRHRLCAIPLSLRPYATDLAGEFLALQPDVVHAWLDHANICAAVAALAVGVPRVVLTFRSLNPTHFPAWCQPWMLPCYRVLEKDARVHFVANSNAGADDYARWIGIDRARISVVPNGIDPALLAAASAPSTALRDTLCAPHQVLVAGVFRIGDEKQPMLFAEVARRTIARVPDAVFVVAGDGPMRNELAHATRDLGSAFQLLGRRSDAPAILGAADAALLTSRVEGTPNVLIEAQLFGTPVVATRVGGIPDAVREGVTGFLAASTDVEGLTNALVHLLSDREHRERASIAAQVFVREAFSLERMTRAMAQSYE